jgi:2-(1,2-epoxy-1,2-dihydrophenyl)acetyl-CoA isomerase
VASDDDGGVFVDERRAGDGLARGEGRTAVGYQTLLVERAGAIATITLNRPDARNAIDLTMRQELVGALDEVEADEATRVLILAGSGGHFCAGGDVKSMRTRRLTAAEGRGRVELLNRMVLRLVDFPCPTIAMVDGYAVGAGTNLALCCDLVVASDRAKFGELFNKIGLVPDGGGTWLLSRLVGLARAKELIFTGEVFDAAEAARIGLVNRVVPVADLGRVTRALAEKVAAGPPGVLRLAKHMVNRAATSDLAAALDLEAYSQGLAIASDDHQEGLAAFFDKRPPAFTGK